MEFDNSYPVNHDDRMLFGESLAMPEAAEIAHKALERITIERQDLTHYAREFVDASPRMNASDVRAGHEKIGQRQLELLARERALSDLLSRPDAFPTNE